MAAKPVLRPRVLCALDFGTTFSGFAFTAVSDDESKIFQWYDWPGQTEGGGLPYAKTRTELLLDGASGEVMAWGWPAFVQHSSAAPPSTREEANQPVFASRFKLLLAPDADDTEFSGLGVRELVSKYLEKLGGVALDHIRKQLGAHIRPLDVQWCITVPAVWDEAAKATMADCMADAGLVAYRDSAQPLVPGASAHKLLMVLEPEAASIYCHHKLKNKLQPILRAGGNTMCVDCGGGTCDIVVHCRDEREDGSLSLREVAKGSGACVGGSTVDAAFLKLMSEIVPVFDEYAAKHPKEVMRSLMQRFELAKRSFDGSSSIELDLPPKLVRMFYEYKGANYEEYGADDDDDDFGTLTLTVDHLTRVFDEAVNPIVELIDEQLRAVPGGCRDMLVVGGFAASPYLMQRLKKEFSSRVPNILQPPQSGSAILEGAVLYGIRPEAVHARRARLTYGINTTGPWRSSYAGNSCLSAGKFINEETKTPYADNLFLPFISVGSEVKVGFKVKKFLLPLYNSSTLVGIDIYSAKHGDPVSCLESGVKREGRILIALSEYSGVERSVEVTMSFGDTMIEVTAVDKTTGKQQCTTVEFAKTFRK